jgi:hypothetical protein
MEEQNAEITLSNAVDETTTDGQTQPIEQTSQATDVNTGEGGDTQSTVDSKETDETPFNNHPAWKRMEDKLRVQQEALKAKEAEAARLQASIGVFGEATNRDPELAKRLIDNLESMGQITAEDAVKAREQIDGQKKSDKSTNVEVPEDVKKAVESLPEVQWARNKRQEELVTSTQRNQEINMFLKEFENQHPDIAVDGDNGPMAQLNRSRIGLEAAYYIKNGMDRDKAYEMAYKFIVKREDTLNEYKEKGAIEGFIQRKEQDGASVAGTGGQSGKAKASLSPEEERNASLAGMTPEEWAAYRDNPDAAMWGDK